jgi:predicted TIM-barrel fold metal-dependent hydrolase
MATPIIDVDTHWSEPPHLWTKQAPASLRERAPRVVHDARGRERWVVERDLVLGPPGFCVVRADGSKLRGRWTVASFAEMNAAAHDPRARLATMDALGLYAQLLYPNALGFAGNQILRVEDAALRSWCIRAYNDGAAELQRAGAGRLFPQALLPFWDVAESVRELARCHEELKLTGFAMTDGPEAWSLPPLHDPHWTPLWAEAEARALPVNFHIGSGGFGSGVWAGLDTARNLAALSTVSFLANMRCLANLIFSGLLDRFPRLRFVSVESGVGWIPFLLEACEYQMDENAVPLALRPREYFRRQIYASFWFEREGVARDIEALGEDNVMFETDFPHPTCLYPGVEAQLEAALAGVPPRARRKVLCENAARVYGIALPDEARA